MNPEAKSKADRVEEYNEVMKPRQDLGKIINFKRLGTGILTSMFLGGAVFGGLMFLIGLSFFVFFTDHISFPWLVVYSLLIFIFYTFIYGRFALQGGSQLDTEIRRRMDDQKRYGF